MENFTIEVEFLRSIFKCNNYTVNIIDQCNKKFWDKLYAPKQIVQTVPKRELLVVLPYLGTFSLNLRKRLYKSVSNSLPQCNTKVVFQSKDWLNSFFYLRSHLIYKFQCSNCKITYYSETECHLKVRAGEHISTSPLAEKWSTITKIFSSRSLPFVRTHVLIWGFYGLELWATKVQDLITESLLVTKDINHYWANSFDLILDL